MPEQTYFGEERRVNPFEGECCAEMIDIRRWRVDHDRRHMTIDELFDKILNRLPLWATIMMTISGGVIGSLITIVLFFANQLP